MEKIALDYLKAHDEAYQELAKAIWERPELGLQEQFASRAIAEQLETEGFSIQWMENPIDTAFIASWGEGKPILGVLGEYDALPGLSQKVSAVANPIEEGAPGHGCGHNLLGVGALAATVAAKRAMEQTGTKGTLRYYGCPAEETLVGKVYMAREGVFDDLDAALTWHPGDVNAKWGTRGTNMNSFKVNFHGVTAHAGGSPEAGRSALDAVQLMDVGVNYMREHIISKARVHCVITQGGEAPNVVPAYAQIWYYVRAPERKQVEEIYAWMQDIAQGAALMTGTTFDIEFITGCYDTLWNDVLDQLLFEKLVQGGVPIYTEEEIEFARQLQTTFPEGSIKKTIKNLGLTLEEIGDPLCDKVVEPDNKGQQMGGSTDVGDVSYIAPTTMLSVCTHGVGDPGHSWQMVAASGSSIGFKGMMAAARAIALALLELETSPDLLDAAKKEFVERTGGRPYVSPLPDGAVAQPAS